MKEAAKVLKDMVEYQEALKKASGKERVDLLEKMGDVHNDMGKPEKAIESFLMALREGGRGDSLLNKIMALMVMPERLDLGLRTFEDALRTTSDPLEAARIQIKLGILHRSKGDFEKGREAAETAIGMLKAMHRSERNIDMALASACNISGLNLWELGDYPRAKERFEMALITSKRLKDEMGVARAKNNLAIMFTSMGELNEALENFNDVLAVVKKAGIDDKTGLLLNNIGFVKLYQGDLDEAERAFLESKSYKLKTNERVGINLSTLNLGMTCIERGDLVKAKRMVEKAIRGFKAIKEETRAAQGTVLLGEIAIQEGDLDKAGDLASDVFDVAKKHKARELEGFALGLMGQVSMAKKDLEKAETSLKRALSTFKDIRHAFETARTMKYLAIVLKEKGDLDEARRLAGEARSLFSKMGARLELEKVDRLGIL